LPGNLGKGSEKFWVRGSKKTPAGKGVTGLGGGGGEHAPFYGGERPFCLRAFCKAKGEGGETIGGIRIIRGSR